MSMNQDEKANIVVSVFRNFWDKEPRSSTLEAMVEAIRSDERTRELTAGYRRQRLDALKNESMLFAVPCIFEGGKAHQHVVSLTGMSMVDFDHVNSLTIEHSPLNIEHSPLTIEHSPLTIEHSPLNIEHSPFLPCKRPKVERTIAAPTDAVVNNGQCSMVNVQWLKRKLCSDPHTLLCYTTISGEGLRVLYRYELDTTYDLKQQMLFYKKAFAVGNAYYEQLIGAQADGQCKNVTRLSVVAHDAEVYYNPAAEAFTAEWIEQQWLSAAKTQKEDRRRDREQKRIQARYDQTIRREVEAEGGVYAAGSHNDYVMRVGYKLNQFGFSQEAAVEWAAATFADYDKAASVVASCYNTQPEQHASRGGRKRSIAQDTGQNGFASVEEIEAFLTEHVQLRRNVISSRVEYKIETPPLAPPLEGRGAATALAVDEQDAAVPRPFRGGVRGGALNWQPISDTKVNSLWKELSKTRRVFVHDIYRIIESDYVPEYHPFREYLEGALPQPLPKGRGEPPDYIRELAETVRVKGGPDEQELFYRYLKKWLVAMVAAWVDESVVNNVILVLIGEQGSYKTTWFNYLLPPELKQYFYTKTNSNRMSKDDLLTLAQYGLVCCEELDTMSPRDLNQLKAAVTMPSINERAAYAHYHEHRGHIASFCGTGNSVQFLSDPTGNRRWLPFEVEYIHNPRDHPFNYRGIYAQAYRLYREGFQFWFNQDEIRQLSRHNEHYETPKLERELVDVYFRQPRELEGGEFMPVSRAMQIVGGNTIRGLNEVRLGRAFRDLGFRSKRTCQGRGYLVVCRTADEIKVRQRMLAAADG